MEMALYIMHISFAHTKVAISVHCVCTLAVYCLGAVTLVDTFERHVHISLSVSNLQALCGKDVHCHQQRIPIKAHPQWRGNTLPIVCLMCGNVIIMILAVCSPSSLICASPAVKRGHSLTVHWLAWPRHSRGPPTILKWALPSPDTVGPVLIARIKLRVFLEFTNFWFANLFY